jgi:hypothetical protein
MKRASPRHGAQARTDPACKEKTWIPASLPVTPAKAGAQSMYEGLPLQWQEKTWIPACARMTC